MSTDWHKKPVTGQKKPTIGYIIFSVHQGESSKLVFVNEVIDPANLAILRIKKTFQFTNSRTADSFTFQFWGCNVS
jgi:hypothetical protein